MLHINIVGVVTCSDNSTRRLVTCITGSFFQFKVAGSNPSRCTVECDLRQVVHTHCPAPLVLQPHGAI